MAAEEKTFYLFLTIVTLINQFETTRFGHPSLTLKTPTQNDANLINFDLTAQPQLDAPETHRFRRSAEPHFNVSTFKLKDTHFQLVVHWAGRGSNVIVFLAKDSSKMRENGTDLFFSYDYGRTFENKSSLLTLHDGKSAVVNSFFNSAVYNSHYVFTDLVNQYIFTTTDYGKTFTRTRLSFIPDVVSLHITNVKVILAMSKNDTEKKLWLSEDFGETWTIMQLHVKSFFWGIKGIDGENVLYIERAEPSGKSSVLRYSDFSIKTENVELLITNVEDYQLKDKYMFATRRQRLLGSNSKNGSLQLWVSYDRGPFLKAVFPNTKLHRDYFIPDASEGQVFVCVNHDDVETNLYISDVRGLEYSLSLERVFYYSAKGGRSDMWLSYVTEETFADFYKIEGLTGVYIASQLQGGLRGDRDLGPEDLRTLITFDKGGHWMPLNPPKVDENGNRLDCKLSENCSLHLSQRFNQLYPPLRTALIRSQRSAVGLIMASGVLGKSLKGHPAIFMSTDAGYSWHKILDGNYFYAIGDHGGIIAAVKTYWGEGSTNELIYSVDEGESWETLKFSDEKIRVYGLMTEPGEKTTTFTLFGSLLNTHQWLIITIDLKPAFGGRKCEADDYKRWSPSDGLTAEYRHCLLGQEESYERRISKNKCYNGEDYERVVKVEKCECRLQDYECDVGFKLEEPNFRLCIYDNSSNIDSTAIPESCTPTTYFNRTRGYRKIPGDVCQHTTGNIYDPELIACPVPPFPEFILFSRRQTISRISLADEPRVQVLPIPNLRNVIAIEYNMKENCVYWADIDDDNILSLCLDGKSKPEILVDTGLKSIEGLAFDWLNDVLYFVDGENAKIEVIRTDIKRVGRMRRTVLASPTLDKPRGIALHPVKGFLFWTDWGAHQPCISRSSMSGRNVSQLITTPKVFWPNGITVDRRTDRIYWVDAKLDYVATADLDGANMRHLVRSALVAPHPFAVAVHKSSVYWDDWIRHTILVADKSDGTGTRVLAANLVGVMDLKIYDRELQTGPNQCARSNCTHLCLPETETTTSCLCPDGFRVRVTPEGNEKCLCADNEEMDVNGLCKQRAHACAQGSFACSSGLVCVPLVWRCDGDDDCGDGSDELGCAGNTCAPITQYACANGMCVPARWRCDSERDCSDGSDEANCTYESNCDERTQFTCTNGACVNKDWVCDLDDDCRDGSDEVGCGPSTSEPGKVVCGAGEFKCTSGDKCVHEAWRCDGDADCVDGSDEADCANHTCRGWQFACGNGRCVFRTWVCDGHDDCKDGSDEVNCTTAAPVPTVGPTGGDSGNCTPWLFKCKSSGKCVPAWWKCDRLADCSDGSDEFDCAYSTEVMTDAVTTTPRPTAGVVCGENHFMCDNGDCIWQSWVCDNEPDCKTGEDENNCSYSCGSNHFRCRHSAGCIPRQYVCNGIKDCADNSDETACALPTFPPLPSANFSICGPGSFECSSGVCIAAAKHCDGNPDCLDSSDELDCAGVEREYALDSLTVDSKSVRKSAFAIYWTKNGPGRFEFMPAIRLPENSTWQNKSWIRSNSYTFNGLEPFALYVATVFVRPVNGSGHVSQPTLFVQQRTLPDVSSPPRNLSVRQMRNGKFVLTWEPPAQPNSHLLGYRVYLSPPFPPKKLEILRYNTRNLTLDDYFSPNVNYTLWLTAVGLGMESNASNRVTVSVPGDSMLRAVTNLGVKSFDELSVFLTWDASEDKVDGYLVSVVSDMSLTRYGTRRTPTNSFNATELSPGLSFTFKVQPYAGDVQGPPSDVQQRTKGKPLHAPRHLTAHARNESTVELSWELPNDTRKAKWEYGISYGLDESDLLERGIVARTSKLTHNVSGLNSCESYAFVVRLVYPYGLGPTTDPAWSTTHFDLRSAPRTPKVTIDGLVATIKWRASCEHVTEPIGYRMRIEDTINRKTSWFQLEAAKVTFRTHNITMNHGGHYTVQIQTTHTQSKATKPIPFKGPPLPTPHQLKLMQTNDKYQLVWESRDFQHVPNHKPFSYQVLVSENETDFSKARIYRSKETKLSLSEFPQGHMYYMAVQLRDEKGYLSEPSEVVTFYKPYEPTSVVLNTTIFTTIIVSVSVLVVALIVALAFLYIRHKRLQRVTLTFANSHYNTRSGTTTFLTGDDIGDFVDDEDSPMIRGFSDDEPLVIA